MTLGLRTLRSDTLAQRFDQWNGRIAGTDDGLGQCRRVIEFGVAGGGNRRHGLGRNQSGAGLGARQRGLEIQHALQPAAVAEDRAHGRLGEIGVEKLVA